MGILVLAFWQAALQPAPSLLLACGTIPGEVRLTIENGGGSGTAILLGITLANGRWYLPSNLVVEIRRPATGETETLQYHPVDFPAIAGRIDHWVTPLPAKASFSMTLRAVDFISTTGRLVAGPTDELQMRFTGRPITGDLSPDMSAVKGWRLWTGTAASNVIRIRDCAR